MSLTADSERMSIDFMSDMIKVVRNWTEMSSRRSINDWERQPLHQGFATLGVLDGETWQFEKSDPERRQIGRA